jgi:sugar phosphate isomerase/epimerase
MRFNGFESFSNPLDGRPIDDETRKGWERLIDAARLFDCAIVTGFTGRLIGAPISDSMGRFVEVFGPLAKRAADQGVRLAFWTAIISVLRQ